MAKKGIALGPARPFPPKDMGTFRGDVLVPSFQPAQEVTQWVMGQLIVEGGTLYNEDHKHLEWIDFQFLWAASGFTKQMRQVIGQAEEVTFRCGAWQKGRQNQQMYEWFGRTPKYLITLDAAYCAECSDLEFCALVEHELYHIGQERDAFGAPAFNREGQPKVGICGHEIEEFVGVIQRYGVGHPEGAIAKLIQVAQAGPTVGKLNISRACGTCLLKVA